MWIYLHLETMIKYLVWYLDKVIPYPLAFLTKDILTISHYAHLNWSHLLTEIHTSPWWLTFDCRPVGSGLSVLCSFSWSEIQTWGLKQNFLINSTQFFKVITGTLIWTLLGAPKEGSVSMKLPEKNLINVMFDR